MGVEGIDSDFIKTITTSSILSKEDVEKVIEEKYMAVEAEIKDKKITTRSIVLSLVGTVVASLVGGILWGLQIIYSQRIFYIFCVGLAVVNYFIIKGITRQSKNNVVVATGISVVFSVLLEQILFEMVGPM